MAALPLIVGLFTGIYGAVAAMMARTAVLSALYNVKTNLSQIKDRSFVDDMTGRVKFYEAEIEKKEQKIRSKVVERFIP